jgi:hypothetical protein
MEKGSKEGQDLERSPCIGLLCFLAATFVTDCERKNAIGIAASGISVGPIPAPKCLTPYAGARTKEDQKWNLMPFHPRLKVASKS